MNRKEEEFTTEVSVVIDHKKANDLVDAIRNIDGIKTVYVNGNRWVLDRSTSKTKDATKESLERFVVNAVRVDYQRAGYLLEGIRNIENGVSVYVGGHEYRITVTKK